jgi:hypothetical protein
MKWIKRKVIKWVREDWEDVRKENSVGMVRASRDVEANMCDAEPILNFRVFSAVGGQIVEFRRYDRKTDRNDTSTYIIHKDDDFGEKISKIANLELLK